MEASIRAGSRNDLTFGGNGLNSANDEEYSREGRSGTGGLGVAETRATGNRWSVGTRDSSTCLVSGHACSAVRSTFQEALGVLVAGFGYNSVNHTPLCLLGGSVSPAYFT